MTDSRGAAGAHMTTLAARLRDRAPTARFDGARAQATAAAAVGGAGEEGVQGGAWVEGQSQINGINGRALGGAKQHVRM
eukprot:151985-Chlamydomonas_euryale.AAC.4